MPSLGSILSIARTGLLSSQKAIDVSAHNISNATTEGYTRQRVDLNASAPLRLADGIYGTGVTVRDVERLRDGFLDSSFRTESGDAARYDARSQLLVRLEAVMAEPGEHGLGTSLDALFSGFSELASTPTSVPLRSLVISEAQAVTREFQRLSNSIDSLRIEAESRLSTGVERINTISEGVANLNQQIVTAEADGYTAGDLRDQRDGLLDELSQLAAIAVTERANGSVGVHIEGISVVDGAGYRTLEPAVGTGNQIHVRASGSTRPLAIGGALAGYTDVLNTDLPETRTALDALAATLVETVNAELEAGVAPDGTTAPNQVQLHLFDAAKTQASDITVSLDDPAKLAAGTGTGSGDYLPGNNDIALAIAGLRDGTQADLGGGTFREFHAALVSDVGQAVRFSDQTATVHRSLADQASLRRQSMTGVSTDEELVNLIQFQAAYGAAARVVSVADEMMQTLLSI